MRKNRHKNRLKRLENNKRKRPVSKQEKVLLKCKTSLKTHIEIAVILIVFFLFIFITGIMKPNHNNWKTTEIIYDDLFSVSYKGATRYYLIYDSYGNSYKVPWNNEFEASGFKEDIKAGDKLTIQYHKWFFSDLTTTLKSDKKVYRSELDAQDSYKRNQKEFLTISLVLLFLILLCIISLLKTIRKYKSEKVSLIIEEEKYKIQQKKSSP